MAPKKKITVLPDAEIDVREGTTTNRVRARDLESIPADRHFRVAAVASHPGYLYVVEVPRRYGDVAVIVPSSGNTPLQVAVLEKIAIPSGDQWLTTPTEGRLYVVIADEVMTIADWDDLIDHGRDGAAQKPKGSDCAVGQPTGDVAAKQPPPPTPPPSATPSRGN